MISVYITVPNSNGWVHKSIMFAIIKMLFDKHYRVRFGVPTKQPYVNNLHHIVLDWLESGEDYLLTLDADNPPIKNPLDLIEFDCDIISCPTPIWRVVPGSKSWHFNALDVKGNGYVPHKNCTGLQEVDAVGTGCILIARRVMLKLKNQQLFSRIWNKNGIVEISCDYAFCCKAKKAGFRVWAHYDYQCQHYNELDLIEVIQNG